MLAGGCAGDAVPDDAGGAAGIDGIDGIGGGASAASSPGTLLRVLQVGQTTSRVVASAVMRRPHRQKKRVGVLLKVGGRRRGSSRRG